MKWSLALSIAFFLVAGCCTCGHMDHSASTQPTQPMSMDEAGAQPTNQPPAGYAALFDGSDLKNWRGRKPDLDPLAESKMTQDEREQAQTQWNADRDAHWRVDNGELVSDGHGVYLATEKDYRDFDLFVDWKIVSRNGDSGVYLRGYPQVQIWDPENPGEVKNGAPRGSGALWNDNADNPGKWPLVKADRPIGQWNQMHVRMIGSRVWVTLNGQTTVDGQLIDNYFDRARPVAPAGPIELQTHGSEIRFRNVYVREIDNAEANKSLDALCGDGFKSVFNGKDLTGWGGPVEEYEVKDGAIVCKPKQGGTIHTIEEFDDFEVKVEFRLPPAGNNGLAIRYPGKGDTAYVGMCELQILDDTAAVYKKLDPRQYCCSIYGVVPAKTGYLRPVGEWNFEHAIIKGHTIRVELNGNVVVDADVSTIHDFMNNHPHPGLMRLHGSFGLAGHDDPVAFRSLFIKPLPKE